MRIRFSHIIAGALFLALPLGAMAMEGMEHGKKMKGMNHGSMEGMEHSGMKMDENTSMLGDVVVDGVKAMGHVKDVSEAMAEMGMEQTHHFAVMFMDTETGEPIEEGTVALMIAPPSGKKSGPVKLMGMQGHFGADITLSEKGRYTFIVGTKLPDGEKRQFEFAHSLH
jgi:hypothetical protein